MKKLAILVSAASFLLANAAMASSFVVVRPPLHSSVHDVHWVRKGWGGYGGPPYGIQYSPAYGYAFNSSYYRSGYAGCSGVRHMCASRWGWAGSNFRRCLWTHSWC